MLISLGPVEFEDALAMPGQVRLDYCGITDHTRKPKRTGGFVEVRVSKRRLLRLTVWTQFEFDVATAASEATWRRIERMAPVSGGPR